MRLMRGSLPALANIATTGRTGVRANASASGIFRPPCSLENLLPNSGAANVSGLDGARRHRGCKVRNWWSRNWLRLYFLIYVSGSRSKWGSRTPSHCFAGVSSHAIGYPIDRSKVCAAAWKDTRPDKGLVMPSDGHEASSTQMKPIAGIKPGPHKNVSQPPVAIWLYCGPAE